MDLEILLGTKIVGRRDVTPRLVTKFSDLFAMPLTFIYNQALDTFQWPDLWKHKTGLNHHRLEMNSLTNVLIFLPLPVKQLLIKRKIHIQSICSLAQGQVLWKVLFLILIQKIIIPFMFPRSDGTEFENI